MNTMTIVRLRAEADDHALYITGTFGEFSTPMACRGTLEECIDEALVRRDERPMRIGRDRRPVLDRLEIKRRTP